MSAPQELDLGLDILDHQLVDCEGRRCGNVDDLEVEGLRGGGPRVRAILVGPPVWKGRGWLGRLAAFITPGRTVRVPWEEVERIDAAVHLRKTARELRLGRGDDRARKWVEWIPGS
jgi:sporulation protein YlmC with PRC-barrel domain